MSWIRRMVGLDGVDIVIQAGVTMFLMIMASGVGGVHEEVPIAAIGALSLVVLGVRRQRALKRGAAIPMGQITGEVIKDRIADLDARLTEVDALTYRVQELEERLDFTERMLAQARTEPQRIGEGQ